MATAKAQPIWGNINLPDGSVHYGILGQNGSGYYVPNTTGNDWTGDPTTEKPSINFGGGLYTPPASQTKTDYNATLNATAPEGFKPLSAPPAPSPVLNTTPPAEPNPAPTPMAKLSTPAAPAAPVAPPEPVKPAPVEDPFYNKNRGRASTLLTGAGGLEDNPITVRRKLFAS